MDKNILKQLKTDYEDLEIKPSVNLWDKIENGLNGTGETVQKPLFQWWKYAAVIVLLFSMGSLFYFNLDKTSKPKEIAKDTSLGNSSQSKNNPIETFVSSENLIQTKTTEYKKASAKYEDIKNVSVEFTDKINEKTLPSSYSIVNKKENEIVEIPKLLIEKREPMMIKPIIAEKKKASYITADDLLIGRELDKTREENNKDQRKFGVFDISKIKGPNSLRIFGFSVISDSIDSE